ncbi:hypothetical protein GWI33_017565 [Rhynchophorus ferrugineus]|uniref:Protein kinase domain-containing protein n=1 Tax=Rhynchophorus ferrugineus TaxID=354439 RepID=A0A834M7I9_RHYFE|nr:hypothetical protein GWI33_017565 [Rhynchophorus ferrugineus]
MPIVECTKYSFKWVGFRPLSRPNFRGEVLVVYLSRPHVNMQNVQDTPATRLQEVEKQTGSDVQAQDMPVMMDTVIKRIIHTRCDMRGPRITTTGSSTANNSNSDKPTQPGTVISDQNCDSDCLESALVADKYQLFEQAVGSSLYRCIDVNTNQELVCKIVLRDNYSLMSAHYRLDSHPRVQSLHEVVVGNRYLYLVFPKAHGDLHSYVRHRKRLRESEAKKLFRQIAETVQLCHQNGIVLRDLKLRKFVFADSEQ